MARKPPEEGRKRMGRGVCRPSPQSFVRQYFYAPSRRFEFLRTISGVNQSQGRTVSVLNEMKIFFARVYTEFSARCTGRHHREPTPKMPKKEHKKAGQGMGALWVGVGCGLVATHHAAVRLQNSLQIVVVLLVVEFPLVRAIAVPSGSPAVPIFPPAAPAISGISLHPGKKKRSLSILSPRSKPASFPGSFISGSSQGMPSLIVYSKDKKGNAKRAVYSNVKPLREMKNYLANRLASHYLLVHCLFQIPVDSNKRHRRRLFHRADERPQMRGPRWEAPDPSGFRDTTVKILHSMTFISSQLIQKCTNYCIPVYQNV